MSRGYAVGIDAGLSNIGIVVAKLPPSREDLPIIAEQYILSTKVTPAKILKRDNIPKTLEHVRRIERQLENLQRVLIRDDIRIRALFAELPVGGGRGASALRGMAFGTAILTSFMKLQLPEMPRRYFSPYDLKEYLTGTTKASKDAVVQRVRELFPAVEWIDRSSEGTKVTTHDVEDAAAALVVGQGSELYKSLYL